MSDETEPEFYAAEAPGVTGDHNRPWCVINRHGRPVPGAFATEAQAETHVAMLGYLSDSEATACLMVRESTMDALLALQSTLDGEPPLADLMDEAVRLLAREYSREPGPRGNR